jgi:uncharacterized lipoprotein YajG
MFMKKILFLLGASAALASCSTQAHLCGAGPKNLIKNSDFAIMTPERDTLFLCEDESMGKYIAELWKEGKFRTEKPQPVVLLIDCNLFDKVTQRVSTNESFVAREVNP